MLRHHFYGPKSKLQNSPYTYMFVYFKVGFSLVYIWVPQIDTSNAQKYCKYYFPLVAFIFNFCQLKGILETTL